MTTTQTPSLRHRIEHEESGEFGNHKVVITEGPVSHERIVSSRWFKSEELAKAWAQEELSLAIHPVDVEEIKNHNVGQGKEELIASIFNSAIKPTLDAANHSSHSFARSARRWALQEYSRRLEEDGVPSSDTAKAIASSIADVLNQDTTMGISSCKNCKAPIDRFGETFQCRNWVCSILGAHRWFDTYFSYGVSAVFTGAIGLALVFFTKIHLELPHPWFFWPAVAGSIAFMVIGGISLTLHFFSDLHRGS